MYPSDYGYTVGGEVRSDCLTKNLENYNDNNCYANDWLLKNYDQWLLSPYFVFSYLATSLISDGHVAVYYNSYSTATAISVSPVVYLASNVKITGGTGELDSPFIVTK